MKKQTENWIKKAEGDYLDALKLSYDNGCYHFHQSSEKYLKSLFEELGIPVPKTHDLINLYGNLIKNGISLDIEEQCSKLTSFSTITRYPGYFATKQDFDNCTTWSSHIRKAVLDYYDFPTMKFINLF